ncbi:MAG: hypothetical protein KatS3mg087_1075 [Patescibacteria group bacterium]|nr:MAG: hypothetical protein KatS3mg087_1075 [Patescibacteria group bacterium]
MTKTQYSDLIAAIRDASANWKRWDHAELFICQQCQRAYWPASRRDLRRVCKHVRDRVREYAESVEEDARLAAECGRAAIRALRRGDIAEAEKQLSTATDIETRYDKYSYYLRVLLRLRATLAC